MDTLVILLSMTPLLVPLAFVLYSALHPVQCPDCGDTLPIIYSPFKKTRRMWLAGGYLCAHCGCETNMAGQKVTAATPPASFPRLQWALLAVVILVGLGLGASVLLAGRAGLAASPAPVAIAAPPIVELPQRAPAVAPVK